MHPYRYINGCSVYHLSIGNSKYTAWEWVWQNHFDNFLLFSRICILIKSFFFLFYAGVCFDKESQGPSAADYNICRLWHTGILMRWASFPLIWHCLKNYNCDKSVQCYWCFSIRPQRKFKKCHNDEVNLWKTPIGSSSKIRSNLKFTLFVHHELL